MINTWVYIIGFVLLVCIGGIIFFQPTRYEAIQETNEILNIKNPIGFFCGADCSDCDHSVDRCLEVLKANLKNLCGESGEQDCYGVWVQYAKTCQYLCSNPMPPLTTAAKMVNLVASDA